MNNLAHFSKGELTKDLSELSEQSKILYLEGLFSAINLIDMVDEYRGQLEIERGNILLVKPVEEEVIFHCKVEDVKRVEFTGRLSRKGDISLIYQAKDDDLPTCEPIF